MSRNVVVIVKCHIDSVKLVYQMQVTVMVKLMEPIIMEEISHKKGFQMLHELEHAIKGRHLIYHGLRPKNQPSIIHLRRAVLNATNSALTKMSHWSHVLLYSGLSRLLIGQMVQGGLVVVLLPLFVNIK